MFLKNGSMIRRLAFLHWLQLGAVRRLPRYYQDAMTSCRPSHRTSFPSFGGTSVALVLFAPRRTSTPPRPGVGNPVSPAGIVRGNDRISQVPGEPQLSVCTCSKPTPAGLLTPDQYSAAAWPLVIERQRLPRRVFRRSIAWLPDSLSTPRRGRYLPTTQDSLPVAGQALLNGLSTRKVPMKGFKVASLHPYPPFPSFLDAIDVTRADWEIAFGACVGATCRSCAIGAPLIGGGCPELILRCRLRARTGPLSSLPSGAVARGP